MTVPATAESQESSPSIEEMALQKASPKSTAALSSGVLGAEYLTCTAT
eukprot:CAMPEP_0179148388 /NCGR_PEP_ID=MMETSP0796-20121207/71808_1 /TAXON_ID=73915 /ORGANISM="Pyrodinium bahamense, Strain pbaha01" /LENGTH=47 /DNA_ID= /DNA_START= /DNA_END= /DNA_ORIENTATION=